MKTLKTLEDYKRNFRERVRGDVFRVTQEEYNFYGNVLLRPQSHPPIPEDSPIEGTLIYRGRELVVDPTLKT